MSNIDTLIEKAKTAIKNNDVDDAVTYDSTLNQYLKTGLKNIHDQVEFHKNQYDFIFKYRLKYYFVEFSLLILILLMVSLTISTDTTGWDMAMYGGASLYLFYKLFRHFQRHRVGVNITQNEELGIINEKLNHERLLNDLSKITYYQMETFEDMTKMYKKYEKENSTFSNLFSNLEKESEKSSGDDSEEYY